MLAGGAAGPGGIPGGCARSHLDHGLKGKLPKPLRLENQAFRLENPSGKAVLAADREWVGPEIDDLAAGRGKLVGQVL